MVIYAVTEKTSPGMCLFIILFLIFATSLLHFSVNMLMRLGFMAHQPLYVIKCQILFIHIY